MSSTDSIHFPCPICNTRLIARANKNCPTTRCPDCLSEVPIPEPKPKPTFGSHRRKESRLSIDRIDDDREDEDEIALLPLPERESRETLLQPSESDEVSVAEGDPVNHSAHESSSDSKMSRKERYEQALQRLREKEKKNSSWFPKSVSGKPAPQKVKDSRWKTSEKESNESESNESEANGSPGDQLRSGGDSDSTVGSSRSQAEGASAGGGANTFVPTLSNDFLVAAVEVGRQTTVVWPVLTVGLSIGLGSALMHNTADAYLQLEQAGEATIRDWIVNTFQWFVVGGVYLVGVLVLWYLAGVVFRHTATGETHIERWTPTGPHELKSTWLLFGFSYFIAGLPLSPIPFFYVLVTPLRFVLAPPFLLAAWYNQDPLQIVAVDAFSRSKQHWREWLQLYTSLLVLALIALLGGWLLTIPGTVLPFFTSVLGAWIIAAVTITFAAIVGWHCGYLVESHQDKDE